MVEVNQHNTASFVWHAYDLVLKHKGLNVNAHFEFKMHVTSGATWWLATSCQCQQGELVEGISNAHGMGASCGDILISTL
jgi:hypothetical protein